METKTRKANGQGHTYQVGKAYKTVIRFNGSVVTASGKTKSESQRKAKSKALAKVALIAGPQPSNSRITFSDYFNGWLEQTHRPLISFATFERYRSLADLHFLPEIGHLPISQISRSHISSIFNSMTQQGLGSGTRRLARSVLSIAFREAIQMELIIESPLRGISIPITEKKKIKPLNSYEVQKLLRVSSGSLLEARLHIALICGLRQGECLGLLWSDIDLIRGTLKIERQLRRVEGKLQFIPLKTESSNREIHLTESTIQVLNLHKLLLEKQRDIAGERWIENNLVFPNKFGKPRERKWDHQLWKNALEQAGIETRSLHNARHTAGTLMYANEVGIETIRRILGHSSVAMTSSTYVHSAEEPLRRAAEAMNEMLKS